MKNIISIFLFFFIGICYSQNSGEALELLGKTISNYEENDFEVSMNYKLVQSNGDLIDEYIGFAIKVDNSIYAKIDQTEFLQQDGLLLKINLEEEAALIAKTEKQDLLFTQNLKSIEKYKKIMLSENARGYIITLIAPEVSQIPYTNVKIFFDKNSLSIYRQEMDLISKIAIVENNKTSFKNCSLIIEFDESSNKNLKRKILNDFIVKKDNKYHLTGQYSSFELFDQTNI